jgi:hypothetical protein
VVARCHQESTQDDDDDDAAVQRCLIACEREGCTLSPHTRLSLFLSFSLSLSLFLSISLSLPPVSVRLSRRVRGRRRKKKKRGGSSQSPFADRIINITRYQTYNCDMVFFKTSILLQHAAAAESDEESSGISSEGGGNKRRPLVFRSLGVDKKSKTPYSDATQVRNTFLIVS